MRIRAVLSGALFVLLGLVACDQVSDKGKSGTVIRIGWQSQWVNQGQIALVLQNSPLLANAGVKASFTQFTYGAPMSEAAAAGQIDVALAGDQPVLTLVTRSPDWVIAARLTRYRSAILVPASSPLKSLDDLRGKKLAAAFGSTTHRDLMRILRDRGLGGEVTPIHLEGSEHAAVMSTPGWRGIDAIATWDPIIAEALQRGYARILYDWPSPGLVAVRRGLIQKDRPAVIRFLSAYKAAYVWYAEHASSVDADYSRVSRLPLPAYLYPKMAAYEPNMSARRLADVHVELTPELLVEIQRNADEAAELKLIPPIRDIRSVSDTTLFK